MIYEYEIGQRVLAKSGANFKKAIITDLEPFLHRPGYKIRWADTRQSVWRAERSIRPFDAGDSQATIE